MKHCGKLFERINFYSTFPQISPMFMRRKYGDPLRGQTLIKFHKNIIHHTQNIASEGTIKDDFTKLTIEVKFHYIKRVWINMYFLLLRNVTKANSQVLLKLSFILPKFCQKIIKQNIMHSYTKYIQLFNTYKRGTWLRFT